MCEFFTFKAGRALLLSGHISLAIQPNTCRSDCHILNKNFVTGILCPVFEIGASTATVSLDYDQTRSTEFTKSIFAGGDASLLF